MNTSKILRSADPARHLAHRSRGDADQRLLLEIIGTKEYPSVIARESSNAPATRRRTSWRPVVVTGVVAAAVVASTIAVLQIAPSRHAGSAGSIASTRAGLEAAVLSKLNDITPGGQRITSADAAINWTDQEQGAQGDALDLTGKTLYLAGACKGGGAIAIEVSNMPEIVVNCASLSSVGPIDLTKALSGTDTGISVSVLTTAGHPQYLVKQIALQRQASSN